MSSILLPATQREHRCEIDGPRGLAFSPAGELYVSSQLSDEVFVFDEAGHKVHRFAACGYALGATYRPTWMDVPPMLYSGNPLIAEPGMVFFLHAIIADTDAGLAMSLGHTLVITKDGREVLSKLSPELPVNA